MSRKIFLPLFALLLLLGAVSVVSAADELIKARFTVDRHSVRIGEQVNFDAGISSPGEEREMSTYYWQFSGMDRVGVDIHGEQVTHVFNHTGAYTVRLIVENDIGERDQAVAFVEVLPDTDDGLSITSNFEGGKTGVLMASEHDFCFRLEWGGQFYFRLDNCAGKPVSLKIIGYGPNRLQLPSVTPYARDYSFDEKFVMMASTDYMAPDWQPLEDARYTYDEETASLVVEFTPSANSVYLAWAPVYTPGRLEEMLDRWEDREEVEISIIGLSVEGRPVYSMIVTGTDGELEDKKVIAITGNQHAYEMAAGWVIEGIMETLFADNDSSRAMLEQCVFVMVPMVNPDGVFRGGYRYNMNDIDLNRNWNDEALNDWDSALPEPEVATAQRFLREWMADVGRMDFFFDFHCLTAIANNLLMIRAGLDSIQVEVREAQEKFTDLFSKRWQWRRGIDDGLSGGACGWAAEMWAREYGVKSFTPEHCLGWIRRAGGEPMKARPELWRELGADYVWVLREFFRSEE
ncbi:MAG: PKD domain-containing protein [Candidatus Glassbacteria bacterium]|nr:PKD domain-containing protein [Candidatus Glassbacteria bacterium]